MIKRRYFDKLPLQANFYPLPAAAYIEDEHTRLTLLTSTALGVAALQPGQIEVTLSLCYIHTLKAMWSSKNSETQRPQK